MKGGYEILAMVRNALEGEEAGIAACWLPQGPRGSKQLCLFILGLATWLRGHFS
jgi:hypothetical protein